jgi:hypothetical protein
MPINRKAYDTTVTTPLYILKHAKTTMIRHAKGRVRDGAERGKGGTK